MVSVAQYLSHLIFLTQLIKEGVIFMEIVLSKGFLCLPYLAPPGN